MLRFRLLNAPILFQTIWNYVSLALPNEHLLHLSHSDIYKTLREIKVKYICGMGRRENPASQLSRTVASRKMWSLSHSQKFHFHISVFSFYLRRFTSRISKLLSLRIVYSPWHLTLFLCLWPNFFIFIAAEWRACDKAYLNCPRLLEVLFLAKQTLSNVKIYGSTLQMDSSDLIA